MSIRPLNSALAEKARVELNEDPERVQGDIQHLKDWIAKQPHLRARTDDQWLLLILRGCKFSLEKAKQKLDLYYTLRAAAPEFCKYKHTDQEFSELISLGGIIVLPNTWGPDTPLVGIVRPGVLDPNKYSMLDIVAAAHIILKIILIDSDNAAIAGIHTILDSEGTMPYFLRLTPVQMKKITVFSHEAFPLRMKGLHFLNMPSGFETLLNVIKNFLPEKNKSRVFAYNKNYEELFKNIPKDILPVEYGGNGGNIPELIGVARFSLAAALTSAGSFLYTHKIVVFCLNTGPVDYDAQHELKFDYWKKKIDQYSSYLEEDEKFGVDESKRPGKPKTDIELFGIDGSFRQLQFD